MRCRACGGPLGDDDPGATVKFIDRNAKEYMCLGCICAELGVSTEFLRGKIEFLRENGCQLFPPRDENAKLKNGAGGKEENA